MDEGSAESAKRSWAEVPSRDLTPALCDAYLRRVQVGERGRAVEVGLHRLRVYVGEGGEERDRVIGLRFRDVVAVAAQAYRLEGEGEGEEATWAPDRTDWVMGLAHEGAMPPVVRTAVLGSGESMKRLADVADDLLWHVGSPFELPVVRKAPILFELSAESVLLTGAQAQLRLFIASRSLEVVDARGPTTLDAVSEAASSFLEAWWAYHEARSQRPDLPDDLQFEWLRPEDIDR